MSSAKEGKGAILVPGAESPEPAFRPITHATLTDVVDENRGNLPSPRYPRSSFENQNNRFYVADAGAAGDMRPHIVKGEKFTANPGSGNKYDTGEVYDRGDTGGSPRGKDTASGE